ncbi:class F sortase [Pseudonocardia sediminis]|uniref:class F sortase n=1 Tax=Pseudonocardia sediminis TaxID=1397368 RepID=UPI001F5F8827|nr:class F sortase [Pseudonocardia sediminis]
MPVAVLAVAGIVTLVVGLGIGSSPDDGAAATAAVEGPPAPVAEPVGTGADTAVPVSLPASPPVSLDIPSIGVKTGLDPLGLNPDSTVQVPTDFARAGWYTGAPTPGQTGPAVLLGHVDSFRGPAVFYELGKLKPADVVEVTRADGVRARFAVESVREYPKDAFPTEEVYGATDFAGLRLITCGGPFDSDARSYLNNTVVYARLLPPEPAAQPASPADVPFPDAPAALAGVTGPPTLYGRVVSVTDPSTAVVEVQRRRITVRVIGLGPTPDCARDPATAFARLMLTGEDVTLVPDPTLPADAAAPDWPAYLVLDSQQSYTDAAIRAGWAPAGEGRYRSGFQEREQEARDAGSGMWGSPCR